MPMKCTYHVDGKLTEREHEMVAKLTEAFHSQELLELEWGLFRVTGITRSFMPNRHEIELMRYEMPSPLQT